MREIRYILSKTEEVRNYFCLSCWEPKYSDIHKDKITNTNTEINEENTINHLIGDAFLSAG